MGKYIRCEITWINYQYQTLSQHAALQKPFQYMIAGLAKSWLGMKQPHNTWLKACSIQQKVDSRTAD